MAHSLSAKKRVRQAAKANVINRARKGTIKTQIKQFETVLKSGDAAAAMEQFKAVVVKLDTISATSTMHKNTAARKKSRLAKKLNELKAKAAPAAKA